MSDPSLPDLLEALGELFLVPGAFDRARFEALGRASWTGLGISPALHTLLICEPGDLAVDYAGLFLHGRSRPTVHLEASVHATGALAEPRVLDQVGVILRIADLRPVAGVQPDHLGLLLVLQAQLLRQLAVAGTARAAALEAALVHLQQDLLGPLAARVAATLEEPGTPPFYQAAGRLLARTSALAAQLAAP